MLQQQLSPSSTPSATDSFWKVLWSLQLQSKWKLFLWKLLHRALAVKVELNHRGVLIQDVFCDLCSTEPEDLQHLFRMCASARSIWRGGCLGIRSEFNGDLSLSDWIQEYIRLFISQDGLSSARLGTFIGTLWTLWLCRNSRVFRDSSSSRPFDSMFAEVMENHFVFVNSNCIHVIAEANGGSSSPPGFYRAQLGLHPHDRSLLLLQIDGSCFKDSLQAGMGWCMDNEDPLDDRITRGSNYGVCSSPLHAEALACLYGLQWALHFGISSLTVFTDSHNLVSLLHGEGQSSIAYKWLIRRILQLASRFQVCGIHKADRQRVHRAHQIAGKAAIHSICFNINM
ncbi:uncharacterized protein LOC110686259 [Chenopodium quinoa]|uniref:uncharacterized protein LOC110686259 n=1 Tax=Chenopodium quinoa TaxID=63459 RepID=UPI000B7939CB|nr:uncharacterized protein LOC110686259 [Chenopodium quinoa]